MKEKRKEKRKRGACFWAPGAAAAGALMLLCLFVPALVGLAETVYVEARVSRVIDGDTFETPDGRRVRLTGVDAAPLGSRWIVGKLGEKAADFKSRKNPARLLLGLASRLISISGIHFHSLWIWLMIFSIFRGAIREGVPPP